MNYYNQFNRPKRPGTTFSMPSKTVPQAAGNININQLMTKIKRRQNVPINSNSPIFGDFSQAGSYHDVMNRLKQVETEFMRIPAAIREQFRNDPGLFMNFVNNPQNHEKLVEMGLAKRKQHTEPLDVSVLTDTTNKNTVPGDGLAGTDARTRTTGTQPA